VGRGLSGGHAGGDGPGDRNAVEVATLKIPVRRGSVSETSLRVEGWGRATAILGR
jgi:hypothetical protein